MSSTINQTQLTVGSPKKQILGYQKCPSATPQKDTHLHHQLHYPYKQLCFYLRFSPIMWAFSDFALVRVVFNFTEESKERKNLPTHPTPPHPLFPLSFFCPLYFFYCFYISPVSSSHSYLITHSFSCFHLFLLTHISSDHLKDRIFFIYIFLGKEASFISDLMSKKSKGAVLNLKQPYGVGVYEDAKSRLKHENLMQDYHDLQKDSNVMRSKLEAAKQRKLTLAAEVRFLRRRYKYLVETKTMNISQDRKLIQPPKSLEQNKKIKEQLSKRKEARQHRLPPPVQELKAKKRRYIGKEVTLPGTPSVIDKPLKKTLHGRKETIEQRMHHPISVLNHKGRVNINQKERMFSNDFDLNQDSSPIEKGASLLTRAPIFDLNEISTGDEDFQSNVEAVKFEETKKSMIRGLNDEQQNDLKLSICRNAGEGSSRVGKRKISWQDPVALRV